MCSALENMSKHISMLVINFYPPKYIARTLSQLSVSAVVCNESLVL